MKLQADHVRLGYRQQVVVPDLHLDLIPGQFTCLIGPNGCGKSTILHALGRLLTPSGGSLMLDGRNLADWQSRALACNLAILPQNSTVPDGLTVRELVGYGRHPHRCLLGGGDPTGGTAIDQAIASTDLVHLADRLMTDLSGGEQQRVWLAMALAQQARTLILDEPTSYLDIRHQLELMELLLRLNRELGLTLIASLHDLGQAARYADRLLAVAEGRIVADGPPRSILTEALLAEVFKVRSRITWDAETGFPVCLPLSADMTPQCHDADGGPNAVVSYSQRQTERAHAR